MRMSRSLTVALAAFAMLATTTPGRTEPVTLTCVYASKTYSDGAFLCVQKSIALICRSDGERFTWATVTDRDLADRCTTPEPYVHPLRARVRAAYRIRHRDPVISAAKCFEFNGKRYCE